jgi:methionyl-tRNA synthetase
MCHIAKLIWLSQINVKLGCDKIVFSTGTDEHGYKIQKRAAEEKINTFEYCTKISGRFKELFDQSDVKYTDFIRTTEERHKKAVEHVWREIFQRGFIYKSTYNGWYSVNDEAFLTDDQVR